MLTREQTIASTFSIFSRYCLMLITLAALSLGTARFTAADVVTEWNAIAISRSVASGQSNPVQARTAAIVHAAIFDAANAIEPRYTVYAVSPPVTLPASQEAAVVAASYGVLVRLFPAAKPALDEQYAASLAQIPEGYSKTNGIAVGEFVAAEMVSLRSADGSAPISYTLPPSGLGIWRPTSPGAPAVPQWGGMTPFVLESATQFHVAGPPELTTADYAADVNEVKFYGGTTSGLRTPDQTEIARFWAESTAISFNRIARAMAAERQTGLAENARMFALMNMALSDAYVVVFETKYRFNFWRPIHAIRENDGTTQYDDGNPDTVPDPTWTPLLATPAHPEYLSGHSGTASAAAEVLTEFFGQQAGFSTTSTTLPSVVRSLSSFKDAVIEVEDARVFGGIHFRRTCLLSNVVGKKIGKFGMKNYLRPLGDDRSESQ